MNFFGKIFNGIGHVFAWLVGKGLPAAAGVLQEYAPVVGLLAAAFKSRGLEAVQADMNAAIGGALAIRQDLESLGAAAASAFADKLGNIGFDAKSIAAIEAIYQDAKKAFTGTTAPASPGAPQV